MGSHSEAAGRRKGGEKMPGSSPDSCCFCLTLRSGCLGIGVTYCLLYLATLVGYLTLGSIDPGGVRDGLPVSTLDITIFIVCTCQIVVNTLLVVGSVKRIPILTINLFCSIVVFTFKNYLKHEQSPDIIGDHSLCDTVCQDQVQAPPPPYHQVVTKASGE